MKIQSHAIRFNKEQGLEILDQTQLPFREQWVQVGELDQMCEAIQSLRVRGAPLIGVAAALCLGQLALKGRSKAELLGAADRLREARPTAVNLMWAIDAMKKVIEADAGAESILQRAVDWYEDDVLLCDRMAEHGQKYLPESGQVLTHCNTGALATAGRGTALGVFARAHEKGRPLHVYVDETRPLLQGARLTAFELEKLGISHTLICDNMAASLMSQKKIDAVFVGADRIALNGDFANKIGTYSLAVLARYHQLPFYVVAPETTRDRSCKDGSEIPIEIRPNYEVRGASSYGQSLQWASEKSPCFNPAFDVTPASLVTAYIFDTGVELKN